MALKPRLSTEQRKKICAFLPMIPVMRSCIELSAQLGRYPRKAECKNALLRESFWFAIRGINYTAVVRLYEFIDPLLDSASTELLGEPLLVGKGRSRHCTNPEFDMLRRYRHALIGHYIKLEPEDKKVIAQLRERWGDIQNLLLQSLEQIDKVAVRLKEKGLCDGLPRYMNNEKIYRFKVSDIDSLIAAGNKVLPQ